MFWVLDNGSAHRGARAARRLEGRYQNLIVVHTPVHASWLSQAEIWFSIVQREVLTPAATHDLVTLTVRILAFEKSYREAPKPFR